MKRIILGSLVLVIIGLAAGIAQADFIYESVKWSQPVETTPGFQSRQRAEHPQAWSGQIVADDWLCTDPNPVVAVRWWGSYLNNDYAPTGGDRYLDFEIVFHSDDPLVNIADAGDPEVWRNSQGLPYSTPKNTISWYYVSAQESYLTTIPNVTGGSGVTYPGYDIYEYNAYLSLTPDGPHVNFDQTEGTIYWLDIEYDLRNDFSSDPSQTLDPRIWAWQTTPSGDYLDKAVFGPTHNGEWTEFVCHNMAFEIMVPVPAAVILGILGLSVAGIKLRKYA